MDQAGKRTRWLLLNNDLLIITGAPGGLVRCVPRLHHVPGDEPRVISAIADGFGIEAGPAKGKDCNDHRELNAEGVAELLGEADTA